MRKTQTGLRMIRLMSDNDVLGEVSCRTDGIVLITGNRNNDGPESLEATILELNEPHSLPVLTIGHPQRVLRESAYADRIAERILELLLDLDRVRGAGRLYVP